MSIIYLLALLAVGLAIVAVAADSIITVSRRPRWAEPTAQPALQLVPTAERRRERLPFVGPDRRMPANAAVAEPVSSTDAA